VKSNSEMTSLAITAVKVLYLTVEKEYAERGRRTDEYAFFVKSPGLS